jgi:VWFA-related protein
MPSFGRPAVRLPGLPLLALSLAGVVAAQEPPPTFPGGTELVVLDMVVRDEAGALVTDLKPEEVEIYEDGMVCLLQSMRLVRPGERQGPAPPPPASEPGARGGPGQAHTPFAAGSISTLDVSVPPDETRGPLRPNVVVLVFDRLKMPAAGAAREAAAAFARREFPPETWFAVYEIGERIRVRQGITGDSGVLAAAIEQATRGSDGARDRTAEGETLTRQALSAALLASGDSTGVEALDPTTAAEIRQPVGYGEQRQRDVAAQLGRAADSLSRERLGGSALRGLLAITRELAGLKGRKTVLYFSEGLHVPSGLTDLLETLLSEANRANVAVYALDPRGLSTEGSFEEAKLALVAARNLSERAQRTRNPETAAGQEARTDPELEQSVTPGEVQMHSLAEESLRLNTQANLRDLAEATGGFLVTDTNDLGSGLERIGADLRGYYELAYYPFNPFADGRFRAIEVKVRRPGVKVRTRRGYVARPPGASPMLEPHELALAQALDLDPAPQDFGHRVTAECQGGEPGGGQVQLVLQVPLRELRFDQDRVARRYRLHFSVFALVRDAAGAVVARLSRDWPLSGPLLEAPGMRNRSATVKRTLELGPGTYTLETAVGDRLGGGLSVQRTTFVVPAPS